MRLLLVEDTPRLRELLTDAVHGAGWRIDAVATLAEAEEAVATTQSYCLGKGFPKSGCAT